MGVNGDRHFPNIIGENAMIPSTTGDAPVAAPELLDLKTVCRYFGNIHPATLYRGVRAGRYPAPIKVGPNMSRWLADECRAALAAMIAGRARQ
jgi:predicted DNA-binding transcriptional regulator AlpA